MHLEKFVERRGYHHQTVLRFVVAAPFIGNLMGVGGSTIRSIRHENQCTIRVSMHSIFYPDAVQEHGRVIFCSAQDHAALSESVLAILQALFGHAPASETFALYLVIPVSNEHSLLGMGGKVVVQLRSECKTNLFLRALGALRSSASWHVRDPWRL